LLGKMMARGGTAANVAAAIIANRLQLRPLTMRHDSATYVTNSTGAANPSQTGYFVGSTYATSLVQVAGAAGFSMGTSGSIVVNRTTDVVAGLKRGDDEIIDLTIHEAVHAMDFRPAAGTDLERYKTDFRAYWMDARYGPPNVGVCPSPSVGGSSCLSTAYDPNISPPGPKSPRARAIFNIMYGNATYPFVQQAYDNNVSGFREAVDSYLIPDGINLTVSLRLEGLRSLIEGWSGSGFAAFQASVRGYMGVGSPPAVGALTSDERDEISRNRAWRDLVERKVTVPTQQGQIKTDLGIR